LTAAGIRLDDVTAIVLAGGRSARFGSDKLAVEVDGVPLLQRALAAVDAVVPRIVIVVAPGSTVIVPTGLAAEVRVVHDPEAFGGPLIGLATALGAVATSTAIVVGGDMPRMVPAVLHRLAVTIGPRRAATSLEVPGRVQPLPMAIDVEAARDAAQHVIERGGRALRDLLRELEATAVPAPVWLALDPTGATIADIDRPADLEP
jgi:molybdopterin-guanine dinucleotide biosynthesis protein A